jgi:predicted DNA-binding transcriptional regulator YafY
VRSSRLVALLLHLQRESRATAGQLASLLEVSERTIYRDIAALQAAGVPLWTETGPGGGVRLVEGWRTDLDGLTADEASSLFLSGAPGAAADLGLGTVLVAAQTKVLSTLPPELRARADRVRERFLLDAPDWFHRAPQGEHLAGVADAVWSERRLDVRYRRGDREVRRRLDPLGLVCKAGAWYLVAGTASGDIRTYRVDRITGATIRDDRTTRPDGFDLASFWAASAADFNRSMLHDRVRLRVGPRAFGALRFHVDEQAALEATAHASEPDAEGWRTLDLAVESVPVAAHQLVALGGEVEALAPPELRALMAEVGRAIVARHAAAPPVVDVPDSGAGGRHASEGDR